MDAVFADAFLDPQNILRAALELNWMTRSGIERDMREWMFSEREYEDGLMQWLRSRPQVISYRHDMLRENIIARITNVYIEQQKAHRREVESPHNAELPRFNGGIARESSKRGWEEDALLMEMGEAVYTSNAPRATSADDLGNSYGIVKLMNPHGAFGKSKLYSSAASQLDAAAITSRVMPEIDSISLLGRRPQIRSGVLSPAIHTSARRWLNENGYEY
jgi:hypothetical protein